VTCGPYLPIYLDTYTSRIEDLHVTSNISADHSAADIFVSVKLSKASPESSIQIKVFDPSGTQVAAGEASTDGTCNFQVSKPSLWWPNGQGEQHLYTATATLSQSNNSLDTSTKKFGIRTIKVIQRALSSEPGKTFMFNINGRDIFTQGGDWIPADNLLPRLTRDKYRSWIKIAARGNLNMIRVWGGGIYESEDFFDACDNMGILVWHDYAFACGDFPVHDEYLDSVAREVEAQTLRLRGRASLALLCGGNEDFMLADYDGEPFPGTYLHR
jgi:beta-mannosidase